MWTVFMLHRSHGEALAGELDLDGPSAPITSCTTVDDCKKSMARESRLWDRARISFGHCRPCLRRRRNRARLDHCSTAAIAAAIAAAIVAAITSRVAAGTRSDLSLIHI